MILRQSFFSVWFRQTQNEAFIVFFLKNDQHNLLVKQLLALLIQIYPKLDGIFTTAFFFAMNELFNCSCTPISDRIAFSTPELLACHLQRTPYQLE